ncbi:MAG: hypothetical protein HC888_07610 [Candidatus Competibacteraceae bacterium]|nr:hypothetical protein [Candidatus Competibacteraceae bacterium]
METLRPHHRRHRRNTLNKTVGTDTALLWQVIDPYQGPYTLHTASSTMTLAGAGGRLMNCVLVRAIDVSPFAAEAMLIGVRVSY